MIKKLKLDHKNICNACNFISIASAKDFHRIKVFPSPTKKSRPKSGNEASSNTLFRQFYKMSVLSIRALLFSSHLVESVSSIPIQLWIVQYEPMTEIRSESTDSDTSLFLKKTLLNLVQVAMQAGYKDSKFKQTSFC